jgi:monoamine oxidase
LYPAQPAGESRAAAVNAFAVRVQALCGKAPEHYRWHLARPLPVQPSDLPTQRALLATVDQVYSEALAYLDELLPALDAAASGAINGRHALTSILLLPFNGWNKGLLEAALGFNAASCALSGFAQDHQPDADALRVITLDLAGAWREFAWELNARLLASAGEAACLS